MNQSFLADTNGLQNNALNFEDQNIYAENCKLLLMRWCLGALLGIRLVLCLILFIEDEEEDEAGKCKGDSCQSRITIAAAY